MTPRLAKWFSFCSMPLRSHLPSRPNSSAPLPPPPIIGLILRKKLTYLRTSCIKCHGRGKIKVALRIDTRETLFKGGDSGAVIVPGKAQIVFSSR